MDRAVGQLPLACATKATRTVVSLLARYRSLQTIHQKTGSIRSANMFGIGRTNGHGRECEGGNKWEWGAKGWQRSLWQRTSLGQMELNN